MRIIAGKYKGKILSEFELSSTRPTSDLVRGAIFNILGEKVNGSTFLDLFAGTGAMGIEAISRNAKQVVFVDNNQESINLIKKNTSFLKENNYKIKKCDCFEALKELSAQQYCFDVILIDPPYKTDLAEKCIKQIIKHDLLQNSGVVVWEHDEIKNNLLNMLSDVKTKKYGKKYVTVLNISQLNNFINILKNE